MVSVMQGNLRKMSAAAAPLIEYSLVLGEQQIPLNAQLGQPISLRFTGNIHCIQCGRKTSKSFQQGHCYPCMQRLAECQFCIIHPEKCQIIHGACPENDWAHAQCAQPHIVYLANSSGLKVGITRHTPSRWIDQGACQALPIFKTANRYQAGIIEVCLKQFVNDRTDWRRLLKQAAAPIDLAAARQQLLTQAHPALTAATAAFTVKDIINLPESESIDLQYPIQQYPQKIMTLSFDKTHLVSGILQGIKGQYLLMDTGVINIRKFSGYEVELTLGGPRPN
jgi:hypothetical protein